MVKLILILLISIGFGQIPPNQVITVTNSVGITCDTITISDSVPIEKQDSVLDKRFEVAPADVTQEGFTEYVDKLYDKMQFRKRAITFGDLFDYAEECYKDTLRGFKQAWCSADEYLFKHSNYIESKYEYQLNKDGYYYSYRWITNTVIDEENPIELEYIFVKKPTLEGFIKWIKDQ